MGPLAALILLQDPIWVHPHPIDVLSAREGRIYAHVRDASDPRLACIDTATGAERWRFPARREFGVEAIHPVGGAFLVRGSLDGTPGLAWLDAGDGSMAHFTPYDPADSSDLAFRGGAVRYLTEERGGALRMRRVTATGSESWPFPREVSRDWTIRRRSDLEFLLGTYLHEPGVGLARLDDAAGVEWTVGLARNDRVFAGSRAVVLVGETEIRVLDPADGHVQARAVPPRWANSDRTISLGWWFEDETDFLALHNPLTGQALVLSTAGGLAQSFHVGAASMLGRYLVVEDLTRVERCWYDVVSGVCVADAESFLRSRIGTRPVRGLDAQWEPEGTLVYVDYRDNRTVVGRWDPSAPERDEVAVDLPPPVIWTADAERIYLVDEADRLHTLDRRGRAVLSTQAVPLREPAQIVPVPGALLIVSPSGTAALARE